jgi:hypothetical protein
VQFRRHNCSRRGLSPDGNLLSLLRLPWSGFFFGNKLEGIGMEVAGGVEARELTTQFEKTFDPRVRTPLSPGAGARRLLVHLQTSRYIAGWNRTCVGLAPNARAINAEHTESPGPNSKPTKLSDFRAKDATSK